MSELIKGIKKELKYGDHKVIAKVVGCSVELVKKVLDGSRNHRKGKGAKVIEVALKIIEIRKLLNELL